MRMHDSFYIIYQDEEIIAVHKPSGMQVHRGRRDPQSSGYALQVTRDLLGKSVYPVHRLDRPTSGVLLFALRPEIARTLADAFRKRTVKKTYLAVVRGIIPASGEIDYPLTRDAYAPKKGQILQAAQTLYARRHSVELPFAVGRYATSRYSLAAIEPQTGRMHQIRRHMHHVSHPVIGDTAYGDTRHNLFFREHFGCHRLLLAAVSLALRHPCTDVPLQLAAAPEASFMDILRRLGWSVD